MMGKFFSDMRVWWFASLLLNAVLIGVLIGGALQPKPAGPNWRSGEGRNWTDRPSRPLGGLNDDQRLTPGTRAIIGQALRGSIEASREDRRLLRAERAALIDLIGNPDATASELKAAFERVRQIEGRMRQQLYNDLSEAIVTLPADERAKVGNVLPMLLTPRGEDGRRSGRERLERRPDRSGAPEE